MVGRLGKDILVPDHALSLCLLSTLLMCLPLHPHVLPALGPELRQAGDQGVRPLNTAGNILLSSFAQVFCHGAERLGDNLP